MKATLPTNYQDDILNVSTEGKRKYRMNYNDDGTVSFIDVTPYDQEGSDFGAGDINATNQAVNESFDKNKLIRDMDAINALTEEGYAPDALALKDVNDSLTADNAQAFQFAYDSESGKYGYKVKEADTDVFVPFSGFDVLWENDGTQTSFAKTSTIEFDTNGYSEFIVFFCYGSNEILSAPAYRPHIGVRVTAKDTIYSVVTVSEVDSSPDVIAGRKFKITDSGLSFTAIVYNSDNSPATRGLPVKVYGIK